MRLSVIQEQVGQGQYEVNTHAVADAIVRRLMQEYRQHPPEHEGAQGECS